MKVILKILVIALLHILSVCSITSTAQTYMTAYVESELLKEDNCVGPSTAHIAQWRSGDNSSFEDYGMKAGNFYAYRIKVIYEDGTLSGFSDEIRIDF